MSQAIHCCLHSGHFSGAHQSKKWSRFDFVSGDEDRVAFVGSVSKCTHVEELSIMYVLVIIVLVGSQLHALYICTGQNVAILKSLHQTLKHGLLYKPGMEKDSKKVVRL